MKKILIISYYYKHKNTMASIRAIKLAKYLSRLDYEATVLTSNQKDTWTKQYSKPIEDKTITEWYAPQISRWTYICKFLAYRKKTGVIKQQKQLQKKNTSKTEVTNKQQNIKIKLLRFFQWLFYFELSKQENICMFQGLKSEFKRQGSPHFDTVIATYPTYGAFLMGAWMKKNGFCNKLITDFRDPLYNPGFRNQRKESDFDKKCLRKIIQVADHVVCVSRGIADGIMTECSTLLKRAPTIITNGYDIEDIPTTINRAQQSDKFRFVYTGTLYHGKRCVNMLAKILRELIDEGKFSEKDFSFEYAGPDFQELLSQLSHYGLENTAIDHGFISREESIELQTHANALLLLTWNESLYQGVIPGKLFEYMAIGNVPIIALITGDKPDSEVGRIIQETNSGFACEQAKEKDVTLLKKYIIDLLEGKQTEKAQTKKYDYRSITRLYETIL